MGMTRFPKTYGPVIIGLGTRNVQALGSTSPKRGLKQFGLSSVGFEATPGLNRQTHCNRQAAVNSSSELPCNAGFVFAR